MIGFMLMMTFILVLVVGGMVVFNNFKNKVDKADDKEEYIPTTQDNLPIDYIRQGIIRMKNGSYAAVVKVPSINLELMEAEEKQVVHEQYKQILTSIDFPFQFLQQSRIVDVSDYLKKLEKIQQTNENQFARYQLEFYRDYVVDLVKTRSVLTKKFFLIIPFDAEKEKKSFSSSGSMFDIDVNKRKQKKKQKNENDSDDVMKEEQRFKLAKKQLFGRASLVKRSFSRFEINPEMLGDEELIELFYTSYNKNRSVYQPLTNNMSKNYSSIYVKKGE